MEDAVKTTSLVTSQHLSYDVTDPYLVQYFIMWPVILGFARTYAVYITWPVAAVIGFIGYNLEGTVRGGKQTPWKEKGIKEERDDRVLEESQGKDCLDVDSLKSKKDIPKTVLNRNDKW